MYMNITRSLHILQGDERSVNMHDKKTVVLVMSGMDVYSGSKFRTIN